MQWRVGKPCEGQGGGCGQVGGRLQGGQGVGEGRGQGGQEEGGGQGKE